MIGNQWSVTGESEPRDHVKRGKPSAATKTNFLPAKRRETPLISAMVPKGTGIWGQKNIFFTVRDRAQACKRLGPPITRILRPFFRVQRSAFGCWGCEEEYEYEYEYEYEERVRVDGGLGGLEPSTRQGAMLTRVL